MSLLESMRRRMMVAEEHEVPRQSFLDSELQVGLRLQESELPSIREIGKAHTTAAMSLSHEAGWPTSAFTALLDVEDDEPRQRRRRSV